MLRPCVALLFLELFHLDAILNYFFTILADDQVIKRAKDDNSIEENRRRSYAKFQENIVQKDGELQNGQTPSVKKS